MFETLDKLNDRLPRPALSNDAIPDPQMIEQYVSNGRALRSEAILCLLRQAGKGLRQAWRQVTSLHLPRRSHPA